MHKYLQEVYSTLHNYIFIAPQSFNALKFGKKNDI